MYGIELRRLPPHNLTCFIFPVLFSKILWFRKKKQLFRKKNVIAEEELDYIDIGNLEDSPRLVFTDEECGNLIVVNDGGEFTINTSQKRSDGLQ